MFILFMHEQGSLFLGGGLVPKSLFTLSLIGFIAPVGLLAAPDVAEVIKRYGLRFVLLGFLITMSGALSSILCIQWLGNAQSFGIIGTYVGALTSSPGLAAALESVGRIDGSAEAFVGLGYAIGYIPGVLMVIIGMRLVPRFLGINLIEEREQLKIFLGSYLGWVGLGSTGGVLISALVAGRLSAQGKINIHFNSQALAAIRDLSLSMFLTIVGLRYGYTTVISILDDNSCNSLDQWCDFVDNRCCYRTLLYENELD